MGTDHWRTSSDRVPGWYFWSPTDTLLVLGLFPGWGLSILLSLGPFQAYVWTLQLPITCNADRTHCLLRDLRTRRRGVVSEGWDELSEVLALGDKM